jgi:hypothetical protein
MTQMPQAPQTRAESPQTLFRPPLAPETVARPQTAGPQAPVTEQPQAAPQKFVLEQEPLANQLFKDLQPMKFPEVSASQLMEMHQEHQAERRMMREEFSNKLEGKKEELFQTRHFETVVDGEKVRVKIDENGKVTVEEGPETPPQREARREHEGMRKETVELKQGAEKEAFLNREKDNIKEFLMQNRLDLGNPAIQAELHKLLLLTQKKALRLQQDHNEEFMRAGYEGAEEIEALIQDGMGEIHRREMEQTEEEEDSPQARDLMEYQNEMASLMKGMKEKLKKDKDEQSFLAALKGGRKAFFEAPKPRDLADDLPAYMTELLFSMGIYELPS